MGEAISLGKAEKSDKNGKVYLVGAGPGDPRLITVRGLQCLELAEVVLYDGLANLALLEFAPQAEKISVGKHGSLPIWTQQSINERIVQLALAGKTVVRLKGGDPAVFARTAEELAALQSNGIPFEVVPGITAALAVACYTGIPLTHRDHASAVALVTGQQQPDAPDEMDWAALAKFPGTLIIYMGVTTAAHWSKALIKNGKPAETPAAIVRRCTWGDQVVLRCRLDQVAERLTPASKLRPPVLVVVGDVAALGEHWSWFDQLPFKGKTIWLPRSSQQSSKQLDSLQSDGCQVLFDPVFTVQSPTDQAPIEKAIELVRNRALSGITFSSSNAVVNFFTQLLEYGLDARALSNVKLAAVGPATSKALLLYGLRTDVMPERDYSATGLLDAMPLDLSGQHWLVTTTNHGREILAEQLGSRGAKISTCLCYLTVDQAYLSDDLSRRLQAGQIDCILISSVRVAEVVTQHIKQLDASQLIDTTSAIAMGSRVAGKLSELGWKRIVESEQNSLDSMCLATRDCLKSKGE